MKNHLMNVEPITLEGKYVRLEPLTIEYHEEFCRVGLDPEIWKWIHTPVNTPQDMRVFIEKALLDQAAGTALPFALIDKSSDIVVGSTRYYNIDKQHYQLEIGATWIAKKWQRTAIHTEDLLLLLQHAFETLGCIRVQFKTDSLNEPSIWSMERIGATYEGTFRNHMILPNGRIRHSLYYSILDSDWPDVKENLIKKLSQDYTYKPLN